MVDYDRLISDTRSRILNINKDLKYFEDLYVHSYDLFMMNKNREVRNLHYENYRFFYDIYSDLRDKKETLVGSLMRIDYYLSERNVNV